MREKLNIIKADKDERFALARELPVTIPFAKRSTKRIEDMSKGTFFRFEGNVWLVRRVDQYRESDGFTWKEMQILNLHTGNVSYLEWEVDDEIEISYTISSMKMHDVKNKSNLSVDMNEIKKMADDEHGSLFYAEKQFKYDDDYKVEYLQEGRSPEKAKFFDFVSFDGYCISFERWGEKNAYEYQTWLSRLVKRKEIEIIKGA